MTTVFIRPCQEACCRRRRGETPYEETTEELARRIVKEALAPLRKSLERRSES